MKITFLGTGTSQGVPVIGCQCKVCQSNDLKDKRLRASVLIEWSKYRYVIDCGPDFRTQMLRENVSDIDGILFTHEHSDHSAGLDDIRPIYFNKNAPIPIYALQRVMDDLAKRYAYIFTKKHKYPGAPDVEEHILEAGKTFMLSDKEVLPLHILHDDLPILGYKFDNFAYITDAKYIENETMHELQNLDLLIINALHHREHKKHLNLEEALQIIEQVKPKKAILTHISHYMGLYAEMQSKLPENVFLSYDGMQILVDE